MLSTCAESEEPVQMVTPSVSKLTATDLPAELLTEIFTDDIPDNIKDVDAFLKKIEDNGMKIYRGINPSNSGLSKHEYLFKNKCIYDQKNNENTSKTFGDYIDMMTFAFNKEKRLVSELEYYSKKGVDFPQYPDRLDHGKAAIGWVTGKTNGDDFTVFYRATGKFDGIGYEAIWIISFSVQQRNKLYELADISKCLVMIRKDNDPERKVANIGTVRIFENGKL